MAYNKRQHLGDNTAAIEVALSRPPEAMTEGDRNALRDYSGFGGLKCVLNPVEKDSDRAR